MTLVFRNRLDPDNGRQIFQPVPPANLISNVTQLKAALLTPGNYLVAPGSYVASLTANVAGVSLNCQTGTSFTAANNTDPVLVVMADNFTLTGDWQMNSGIHDTLEIGSATATTQAAQPDNVLIQGGRLVGNAAGSLRGIACHGSNVTIQSCRMENYFLPSQEAQAFWCCNTNGPISILDSFLEGAGENLLSGGSTIPIPNAVPSDVHIARNTFYKRPSWRPPFAVTVKNNFELKNGQRWLIEDNIFDGSWADAQIGVGIVFSVRQSVSNQIWAIVDAITFDHNIVRNCYEPGAFAITILGHEDGGRQSQQTKNITITNNLFEDSDNGIQLNSGVTDLLLIDHNTFAGNTNAELLQFVNVFTLTTLQMTNNAGQEGTYGIFGGGANSPIPALNAGCNPGYVVTANIWGRNKTSNPAWPAGNTIVGPAGTGLILTPPPECFLTGAQAGANAGWNGPAGVGLNGDGTTTTGAP